ncbi:MAG: 50S ribosomal protein L29 [Berkelbacteria bacterium GW2011_GWA2_46_7]|uniref:Large ribosomal subunit protein uL29 n=1 Tax=Berkelbacteria bacterium GW2011_GWA2_46_7 TaxID=1618335 RepID=A0A0G1QGT0_9BACT|nr:MAG: 50S ribosomal protein L29 [Berkelbacteria bacterium GW2011_GWA2_46_7]
MKKTETLDKARRSTIKEISVKITENRKQLFTLNQEKILGKLKNVSAIGQIKKEIARLATVLDEKVSESVK